MAGDIDYIVYGVGLNARRSVDVIPLLNNIGVCLNISDNKEVYKKAVHIAKTLRVSFIDVSPYFWSREVLLDVTLYDSNGLLNFDKYKYHDLVSIGMEIIKEKIAKHNIALITTDEMDPRRNILGEFLYEELKKFGVKVFVITATNKIIRI